MDELSVSIVVPCYNCENFIEQTLDNIKQQTYRFFELILVDDGSKDNTVTKITEWLNNNLDIKGSLIQQENKYQGAARNTGIKNAKADYIAFLDADDYWESNKLEVCMNYLKTNPEVDLICHDEWIMKNGKLDGRVKAGPYTIFEDLFFKDNCLSPSAVILKKDLLLEVSGFNESRSYFSVEDYDLWLRLAKNKITIHYLNQPLGFYVLHTENSTVAKLKQHLINTINLYEDHLNLIEATPHQKSIIRKKISRINMQLAISMVCRREVNSAMELALNTIRTNLFDFKNWFLFLKFISVIIKQRKEGC
ncbi:MAG: glycosyltransferase [Arcobacter sp.]|nr:glycosyltransferase [Arcobacter sp.]